MNSKYYALIILLFAFTLPGCVKDSATTKLAVVAPGAKVQKLIGGFEFTEGPAADAKGNVFFTDIPNNRIHKWSLDGKLSTFLEDSGAANGLFFDAKGNLLVCAGTPGQLISINPQAEITVLAGKYKGKKFNTPNDLWPNPKAGIYFTDPRYGNRENLPQDGEHVYYYSRADKSIIRVIDDMVRPNGIIGTPDGKTLYIADHGAAKVYSYTIEKDGTLSNKKLFAPYASDGMTIDSQGNIYITEKAVLIYDPQGNKIETIKLPEGPANICFGGPNNQTLFITARTSLYAIKTKVKGL